MFNYIVKPFRDQRLWIKAFIMMYDWKSIMWSPRSLSKTKESDFINYNKGKKDRVDLFYVDLLIGF